MPAERIVMRQVRVILHLKYDAGESTRAIARQVGAAPSTVRETLKRFEAAGLSWPLPEEMTDEALEARLYANAATKQGHRRVAEPDWAYIHQEMKRKHVTLSVLWEEYIALEPEGYKYSRFCELYHKFKVSIPVTMRQSHAAGDKLFVDYAGDKVSVLVDKLTGEVRDAQIFVAVMGASNFVYAEASWTQSLPDFIEVHTRALEAINGVPRLLIPDNCKSAVIRTDRHEPQVTRTYQDMAAHYGTSVVPARPYRPRDKAKVEVCVRLVERWLHGRLRNRVFHSLGELNTAIREMCVKLNEELPIRRLGCTRRQLLEEVDRPALKPLPTDRYEFAEWFRRKVGIDYHVEVSKHYYSVPYTYSRADIDVRLTARTVEIFARGKRIASHVRQSGNHRHTTIREHMPSSHQRYAWPHERLIAEARSIGPSTLMLCERILEQKPHPEQGYRSCYGIVGLVKPYGRDRVEAAASHGLLINALTYRSIKSILDNNLDRQPVNESPADGVPVIHDNIRGSRYYN